MPLRDHFRSPLDDETQWEGCYGGWPMMIVACLSHNLPSRYVAAPRVHSGAAVATDLPALDEYEVRVYDRKRGRRRTRQPCEQGPPRTPPRVRRQVHRPAPESGLRRHHRSGYDAQFQPLR
jgi:hypothetical protein